MAILHGSWFVHSQAETLTQKGVGVGQPPIDRAALSHGYLFLWGEVWRRITPEMPYAPGLSALEATIQPHPFAMAPAELLELLRSRQQANHLRLPALLLEPVAMPEMTAKAKRSRSSQSTTALVDYPIATLPGVWRSHTVALPSWVADDALELPAGAIVPQHSAVIESDPTRDRFLYPWRVEGLCLDPIAAFALLNALPLGTVDADDSFIGGDLRFWSHAARWSLDLLARSKFLPGLEKREENGRSLAWARWQPLLDSAVDQVRWKQFVDRMPIACRLYEQEAKNGGVGEQGEQRESEEAMQSSHSSLALPLPTPSQSLIHAFLSSTLDAQIRLLARTSPVIGFGRENAAWVSAIVATGIGGKKRRSCI
jgi:hypothetical protein